MPPPRAPRVPPPVPSGLEERKGSARRNGTQMPDEVADEMSAVAEQADREAEQARVGGSQGASRAGLSRFRMVGKTVLAAGRFLGGRGAWRVSSRPLRARVRGRVRVDLCGLLTREVETLAFKQPT